MNIGQHNQIQGPVNHGMGERKYQQLESLIFDKTGVICTILVKPGTVSIRARDYADYLLAKAAIKGQVSVSITRDLQCI
jgi:hypothetical protein